MIDERLDKAFGALRAETDGSNTEGAETLERVLATTRVKTKQRRLALRYFVPLAAVLVASSAWAGATGRLGAIVDSVSSKDPSKVAPVRLSGLSGPGSHVGKPSEAPAVASAIAIPAPVEPAIESSSPSPAPTSTSDVGARPAPVADTHGSSEPTAHPRASAIASSPVAPTPPTAKENALAEDKADFEAAYRTYASGASAAAVDAWDHYLTAHPQGRFVPEARYARAVALVRAGRTAAAREALHAFADRPEGSYRREDAQQLLDSLGP